MKFSQIAGPLAVVVASFFYEPLDYASTAVQCVTTGCSVADVALTLAPGSLSAMNKLADVFRAAENVGDAVKVVENAGDAVHAAENGGDLAKVHGNNLATTKPAEGYSLRDRDTGEVLKYGETTRGPKRYSAKYLDENNADMIFEAKGTKREMHDWQHDKILEHRQNHNDRRPPLNKSDW